MWLDGIVPITVEHGSTKLDLCKFVVGYFFPIGITTAVQCGFNPKPVRVVVEPINLTMISWLARGRPRQFWVM